MLLSRTNNDLENKMSLISRLRVKHKDLIVDIGNVHNEVNIIAKIVSKDSAQIVLSDIVSAGPLRLGDFFQSKRVYPTLHDPCEKHRRPSDRNYTLQHRLFNCLHELAITATY